MDFLDDPNDYEFKDASENNFPLGTAGSSLDSPAETIGEHQADGTIEDEKGEDTELEETENASASEDQSGNEGGANITDEEEEEEQDPDSDKDKS